MSAQEDFYLVSNAYMDLYPENTLSKFTNKLATPLEFSGQWEVAINEIFYPIFFAPNSQNVRFYFLLNNEDESQTTLGDMCTFSYNEGDEVDKIISSLNEEMKKACWKILEDTGISIQPPVVNFSEGKTSLHAGMYDQQNFFYPNFTTANIYEVLGFDQGHYWTAAEKFNLQYNAYEGTLKPKNNVKTTLLFIYSDIIRDHAVGDASSPLLRVAPLSKGSFESVGHITFNNPYYYKLRTSRIESINILLCDELGKQERFLNGRVHVSLHFRKSI